MKPLFMSNFFFNFILFYLFYFLKNKQKKKNSHRLREVLRQLKKEGYILYCASNSIWKTIMLMLMRKGLLEFFDYFISCTDVAHPKPQPTIYLRCFIRENVLPSQALVVEDSHIGRMAALNSGAHLCPVENPDDVTYEKLSSILTSLNSQDQSIPKTNVNGSLPDSLTSDFALQLLSDRDDKKNATF